MSLLPVPQLFTNVINLLIESRLLWATLLGDLRGIVSSFSDTSGWQNVGKTGVLPEGLTAFSCPKISARKKH